MELEYCGFFGVVSFKKKISAEDVEDIKKRYEEIDVGVQTIRKFCQMKILLWF